VALIFDDVPSKEAFQMSEFGTSYESELTREREPRQIKKKKQKMMVIKDTSEVFAAVQI
jgi:hypothetical protein